MTSRTLDLAQSLVTRPSVTPDDSGCQEAIAEWLTPFGFHAEWLPAGEVRNLWLRRGDSQPLFVFAGHTDVVPAGRLEDWRSPPFDPTVEEGYLYGRGSADMKGSIAAFITACERFLTQHPHPRGSIALLITSDEEGIAVDGTAHVVRHLQARNVIPNWCLVGEPSSTTTVGDVIKVGRRGSLNARLTICGRQGHVAYPHLAQNPIHLALPAIHALTTRVWDEGNIHFPPTSLQITNIHGGVGATNVIPGELQIDFNIRFSTEWTAEDLQQTVQSMLDQQNLNYRLDWQLSGRPFLTSQGRLLDAVQDAITRVTGYPPELSTSGGTSDGRFIAPLGTEVIELGPSNESIHKVNERVQIADLDRLSTMYEAVLEKLLT